MKIINKNLKKIYAIFINVFHITTAPLGTILARTKDDRRGDPYHDEKKQKREEARKPYIVIAASQKYAA